MSAPTVYNGDFEILGASNDVVVGWDHTGGGAVRNYPISGNRTLHPRSGVGTYAEQAITFATGGTVKLSLLFGWRVAAGASAEISVGGVVVWSGTGGGSQVDSALYPVETASFTLAPGTHVLRVQMTNNLGYGLIFDNFAFSEVAPTAVPGRLACLGPGRSGLVHAS
jgi:hypothetical protein